MKVEIDLDHLEKLQISPNQYVILFFLFKGWNIKAKKSDVEYLILREFIKDKQITSEGRKIFNKNSRKFKKEAIKDFVKSWIQLFPKGIKTGGYPVKSSFNDALVNKMLNFLESYDYTEEEIIYATKKYISEKEKEGYQAMKLAKYFIEKQGEGSMLADYCQYVQDNKETIENEISLEDYNIKLK